MNPTDYCCVLKGTGAEHLHEGVEIDLASAQDGMLPRLLHLGDRQGVALVDLAQPLHLPTALCSAQKNPAKLHHR